MWTRLVFAFCAIAVASSANTGWDAGFRYGYQVRGRTLAALHQVADQYTGVFTKVRLEIYAKSQDHLIASLSGAQFSKVDRALPSGWASPIDDNLVAYEQLPLSTKTFEIRLQNGVIQQLVVDSSLATWEVNMIKGIVSQLQMDVNGKHLMPSAEHQLPSDDNVNGVFKTMEQTVTGRCQVQYEVSMLPEYVLQSRPELAPLPNLRKDGYFLDVVKSTNYSHCEKRPFYNFGFPGLQRLELASNQMGDAITRSSMSRAVLSGSLDKLTIQSSVTTHKALYSPNLYNNQKGMIVSYMNVTLVEHVKNNVMPAGPESPRPVKSLLFSYADPYSTGEGEQRSGHAQEPSQSSDEAQENPRWNSNAARRFRQNLKDNQHQERPSQEDESRWSMDMEKEYKHEPEFDQPPKSPLVLMAAVNRKIVNPVRSGIAIAKQIGEELQNPSTIPEKATLSRFDILCTIVRTMSTKQIQDVVHELHVAPKSSEASRDTLTKRAAWKVWRDAVAQAGTFPALINMKEWIAKGMVKGMEAAHMLQYIPVTVRYPTKEFIHYLFRMAEDPQVKKNDAVYTAALMSFSTLLRLAYVDKTAAQNRFPAYIFGRLNLHDYEGAGCYVDYYAKLLEEAVEKEDSVWIQTYIRILGNIAHPKILKTLEPYLEGEKRVTSFQRLHMIVALDQMTKTYPKLVRSVLWRVYQSVSEDPQVRSGAVLLLMRTNLPASMLQRMAESTHFEHSQQVRSTVQTAIQSAANLQAGEDWELISNAKAAAGMVNNTEYGTHYSQARLLSKDIEDIQLTYRGGFFTIGKEDSLLPQALFATWSKSYNGIKFDAQHIGLITSSIQNLYQRLVHNPEDDSNNQRKHFAKNSAQALWSHEEIADILGMQNNESAPIEANLLLKTFGPERFWAIDNRTVDNIRKDYNHIMTHLRRGEIRFDHSRFFIQEDIVLTFPTAMGLPSIFRIRTPTFYSASGKIQTSNEKQQQGSSTNEDFDKITSDLQYTVSSKNRAELSVVTPFDHNMYTAGLDKDMQLNLPIHTEVELDRENNEIRAKLQPMQPEQKTTLFTFRSRPYTAQENILALEPASQKIIHVRKPTQSNITVGQGYTGMAFDVDFSSECQFPDFSDFIWKVQRQEMLSAFLTAVDEPIHNTELSVSYNPDKSTAKTVTITAAYETKKCPEKQNTQEQQQERESGNHDDQDDQHPEQFFTITGEPDAEYLKDPIADHEKRRQELTAACNLLTGGDSSIVSLSAQFQGKTEAKFAAFATFGISPIDPHSHVKIHLHQTPVDKDDKHIVIRAMSTRPIPSVTNYKKAIEGQPKAFVHAMINMRGKDLSADKPATILLGVRMRQTDELRNWVLNSALAKMCDQQMQKGNSFLPACQQIVLPANFMNEMNVNIQYQDVANAVKTAAYRAYSFARYLGWEYHSENALNASSTYENQVRIHARFAPNQKSANVSLIAPTLQAEFTNLRLNPIVAAAVVPHAAYTPGQMISHYMLRDQFYPACVIDKTAVNTFNNVTYPLETSGSWHVVLQTVYQQPARQYACNKQNVTIIARKSGSTNNKEVRVILENGKSKNVVDFIPTGKSATVKINNETVSVSTNHFSEYTEDKKVFAQLYLIPDKSIRFFAPEHNIEIVYRPSLTVVVAGSSLRNQIRGICGTFSGEPSDDFTVPKNCVVKKSEHFVASYAVWPIGTDAEKQVEAKKAPCFNRHSKFANVITDREGDREPNSSESREGTSQETKEQPDIAKDCRSKTIGIKVVEANGELCFSTRPVEVCKPNCRSTVRFQKVNFVCYPKDDSNARHLKELLQRGVVPDLAQKKSNKSMNVTVDDTCFA